MSLLDKRLDELTLDDLGTLYLEAEECDKRIFAEMRTNLQLVAGEHYVKEGSRYWNRIRDDKALTQEQRLKLTKNHTQRVTKVYRSSIERYAPGVAIMPNVDSELKCQKAAQLYGAYWGHIKHTADIEDKIAEWISNFVEIGEVHVKVFWDMAGGNVVGYEAEMQENPEDPEGEMVPVLDEAGQPKQSSKPVYGGRAIFEAVEGYNIRRDSGAKSFKDSPYLIISKTIPRNSLSTHIADPEERKKFSESPSTEYSVFDNNTGSYRMVKNQALVKEIYFRPTGLYPKGYYYIWADHFKIASGELPYGLFPIESACFDAQTGNARGHSVIRHIRPAQIEINRAASKIAEHQVTLGDDKVWVPNNTKVSQGALLPGVRVNTYQGVKPEITQGRDGGQYVPYLESQINEMYKLANLDELTQETPSTGDLMLELFKSARFKQKFQIYGEKFERFLVRVVKLALEISRQSVSEHDLIPAIGLSEYLNIPEFKSTEPMCWQVKLEPRSDDVDSQMGKQVILNHVMQYVGPSLQRDDIGKMIRLSPYFNNEQMFEDFTSDYDNATNDILALDRGVMRPPKKNDNHAYILKRLANRQKKGDFEFLPPNVQQLYAQKEQLHEQLLEQQQQQIQAAEAGFIPSGGYSVACDFYTDDPQDPTRSRRVRIPSESLNWLIQKLKDQGSGMEQLQQLPGGVQEDMARRLTGGQPGQPPPRPGNPGGGPLPMGGPGAAGGGPVDHLQALRQLMGGQASPPGAQHAA